VDTTSKIPNVPLAKFKRTKIIATIGPVTDSYQAILELIKAGVNGIRLNFSHGNEEERIQQIKWIRKASKEYGKPVAIIQDLHGPKMQLGEFEGIVSIQPGQNLTLKYKADYERSGHLPTLHDFSKRVKRGERLLMFDGKIRCHITSVKDGVVHVRSENEGIIIKKKGINLPDTDFEGDIITEKDKKDLAFGSNQDIDYVAVSFIQTAQDIRNFKSILNNLNFNAKIMAKIETSGAVENIEEIVKESDSVMVARGDLATETSPESVPVVQRKIVGLGIRYGKPTVVATQMLASMTEFPEPTRAEVSDIATAVIIGADAVMLSEETAVGKYPIECVAVMKRVILYTQANSPLRVSYPQYEDSTRQNAIASSIVELAEKLEAKAVVAETRTGTTATTIASKRPSLSIIAVTPDNKVANQLALVYGTKSYIRPSAPDAGTKLTDWLHKNKVLISGDMVVLVAGHYPGRVGSTDTIKVRVIE
jgi:pyruvate kinase